MVVTCARKPTLTGSVVPSVLSHGTGAINIGACRVHAGGDNLNGGAYAENATPRAGLDLWSGDRKGDTKVFQRGKEHAGEFVQPSGGRWPANLVLMHRAGCQNTGVKSVPASSGIRPKDVGTNVGADWKSGSMAGTMAYVRLSNTYCDDTGAESVAAWVCQPDCPVAELDQQSGKGSSAIRKGGTDQHLDPSRESWRFTRQEGGFTDTGTASRYFKQIQDTGNKPCPK